MKTARFIVLWLAVAVCWLGVAAGTAAANNQAVVIVDGGGVYNLYTGSALDALMGDEDRVGYLGHDTLMPNVAEYAPTVRTPNFNCLTDFDVSLWYFENEGALSSLSGYQVDYIYDSLQGGSLVGISGDDEVLKNVLAREGRGLDLETDGEEFHSYLFGYSKGLLSDHLVSFKSDIKVGRAWRYMMGWVTEREQDTAQASAGGAGLMTLSSGGVSSSDSSDPWQATYTTKLSDLGEHGNVAMTLSVFEFDSDNEDYDWYRVDANVQGKTEDYLADWSALYNFIDSLDAELYSDNSNCELWEYSPTTTQTNSVVNFELGASLSSKVSADYEKTYDCYEVNIEDYSSVAKDHGEWSAKIEGPNWWDWWAGFGDYEPSTTAQTSYTYEPSTIWRVKKGEAFKFWAYSALNLTDSYWYLVYSWDETRKDSSTPYTKITIDAD